MRRNLLKLFATLICLSFINPTYAYDMLMDDFSIQNDTFLMKQKEYEKSDNNSKDIYDYENNIQPINQINMQLDKSSDKEK